MDAGWIILSVCGFLVVWFSTVNSCSQPVGWERKDLPNLVPEGDLVVYGEFLDATNSTRVTDPGFMDVRINTAIYCVLRNVDDVSVPATIIIEEFKSAFDGRCVNNLYGLKTAEKMILFIRPKRESSNYEFQNVNVQSAHWKVDDALLSDVMKTCAVLNATVPLGASPDAEFSCPESQVTEDTCGLQTGHGTTIFITLSAVLLPSLLLPFLHR